MFDAQEIDKILPRTIDWGEQPIKGRPSGVVVGRSRDSFKPPKINKPLTLQRMNERHHEMARLLSLGYKETQIAEKLNVTIASVRHAMMSPIVKSHIALLRGDRDVKAINLMDEINDILPDAIKLMKNVIDGGVLDEQDVRDRALQVSTAKHLLGIGGLSPVKRIEAKTQTTHLTADDIRDLVKEARDLGMCVSSEGAIDTEFIEVPQE